MWYASKRFILTCAALVIVVADTWLHLLPAEQKLALVVIVVSYLVVETARPSGK